MEPLYYLQLIYREVNYQEKKKLPLSLLTKEGDKERG